MTRLEYWIKADTQYRIHSPFLFEMYRKVLFAEVDNSLRCCMTKDLPAETAELIASAERRDKAYHEVVYKLRDHYGLKVVCYDGDEAVLSNGERLQISRPRKTEFMQQIADYYGNKKINMGRF